MNLDISIVIPTCNRLVKLDQCLRSILIQDYSKDKFEVIIVDDRLDNRVANLVNDYKKSFPNLKYLAQYCKGPAVARNLGARSSQGRIVGFVDDDCVLKSDWVSLMVAVHNKHANIPVVGGDTLTSSDSIPVLASQFLSTGSIETKVNGKTEVIFFPTCNVSIKRDIFNKYSFDENFPFPGGEDLELFWRIFKDNYKFIWDRAIKIVHYRDDTLRSFLKQAYYYGRGNLLVQHIHQDQPLLKELKTGDLSFWGLSMINFIKIPRFSFVMGNRLIRAGSIKNKFKQLSIYSYFTLHKLFYIMGNIVEFFRIRKEKLQNDYVLFQVPRLLILDITHNCNLRCQICDIWKTKSKEADLDISYIKKMLFEAKSLGIKEIALSGGEPLVRNDIFEILEYARKIGVKDLGVLTNGLIFKENFKRLESYLIDNTITPVISFDSLKPELHNYIRNSDSVWQSVNQLLADLAVLKSQYLQVNFNVISIILNQNLEELSKIYEYVDSLGVNSIQFQPLLANNLNMAERKSSAYWVSDERLQLLDSTLDRLMESKQKKPEFIRNSLTNLALIKKYYRGTLTGRDVNCFSALKTILVANQGVCTTCFSGFGYIKKQSLIQILNGAAIVKARDRVKECQSPCLLPCFTDN